MITDAHAAGLDVHGCFLPVEHRSGTDLDAPGDMAGEVAVFLAAGMDGFFTDNPTSAPRPPSAER